MSYINVFSFLWWTHLLSTRKAVEDFKRRYEQMYMDFWQRVQDSAGYRIPRNTVALKIIVTITLGIIRGHWVGVSKCMCTSTHAAVPLWIVWETQKNGYTCAICLTCTVFSYVQTILVLLRAIYTLYLNNAYTYFKHATSLSSIQYVYMHIREGSHSLFEWDFATILMCAANTIINTIESQNKTKTNTTYCSSTSLVVFIVLTCIVGQTMTGSPQTRSLIRTSEKVSKKKQSWTEDGKGKEKY